MTRAPSADGRTGSATPGAAPAAPRRAGAGWTLWLWVAAAFLFMAMLWAAIFTAAHHANIREVPLAAAGGAP